MLHWVCLNCPFHCSSYFFLFLFCLLTNLARAMTLSDLWYDWIRIRSPMGQGDVILLFVHLFLHPRVHFIEVVSNYITRVCTSQMWKPFSSADRRNIIAKCKKRHVESTKRKRSLLLLGVGLMLLYVCDCGHDAEKLDQRITPVITVIWGIAWYKSQKNDKTISALSYLIFGWWLFVVVFVLVYEW